MLLFDVSKNGSIAEVGFATWTFVVAVELL
jgi:hypothetical protein